MGLIDSLTGGNDDSMTDDTGMDWSGIGGGVNAVPGMAPYLSTDGTMQGGMPTGMLANNYLAPNLASGTSMGSSGNSPSSVMQSLLGGQQPGQNLANIASLLGAYSSGQKGNRITQGNFTQGYDQLALQAQNAANANQAAGLKQLAQTNYLLNGKGPSAPPSITLNGKSYNPQSAFTAPAPSAAQQQGAQSLQSMALNKLTPGGSYQPQPLSTYATPSTAENIGTYGALGAAGGGILANMLNGGNGQSGNSGINLSSVLGGISNGTKAASSLGSLLGLFG